MNDPGVALGHSMIWPDAASAYIDTFKTAISSRPGDVVSHQEVTPLPQFIRTPVGAGGTAREKPNFLAGERRRTN
jgi:hypothetical protein